MKVKTYEEYIRKLDSTIVANGGQSLSYNQINDFIKYNHLKIDWNIEPADVIKDMKPIVERYNHIVNSRVMNNQAKKPDRKMVKSYEQYMRLLETEISNKVPSLLSDFQLRMFIRKNQLDKDWGITLQDVKKDIQSLKNQNNATIQKSSSDAESIRNNSLSHTREKKNDINRISSDTRKYVSGLTREDKAVAVQIKKLILRYPELVEDKGKLKNALADIMPEKKQQVNLLRRLIDGGILSDIDNNYELNDILCNKYVSILYSDYGTSEDIAKRMTLIWFHSYGRMIKNKNITVVMKEA